MGVIEGEEVRGLEEKGEGAALGGLELSGRAGVLMNRGKSWGKHLLRESMRTRCYRAGGCVGL